MTRALLSLFIVFNMLATTSEAQSCQDIFRAPNNLTEVAEGVHLEVARISESAEIIDPAETRLTREQRRVLRKVFLQAFLAGSKRFLDLSRFWSPREFQDLSEKPDTAWEAGTRVFLASLVENGQLKPYLNRLLDRALRLPIIGKKIKAREDLIRGYVLAGAIDAAHAIVEMRGMTKSSAHFKFTSWEQLSVNVARTIDQSSMSRPVSHRRDSVTDPVFLKELTDLGGTRFVTASRAQVLVDGPQSFAVREALIERATRSIDMMVWAVLDDITGADVTARLAQKVREGVKVRVMVDGKVNRYFGYSERVKEMESLGIEVVRWEDPDVPFLIQHRKMLIVDGEAYVAGGINVGDAYSHKNPSDQQARWRDTDIYVEGPAVQEGHRLFAELWNHQLESYPRKYSRYQLMELPEKPVTADSFKPGLKIALVESSPHPEVVDGTPIMKTMLKAIRGARRSIDIENAYVVMNPALRAEIAAALARGVRVRVLTNSDTSVDEPIVSKPIMLNARRLAQMGAEVYLKKGDTLHSKVMVVDGVLSMVKSYNLHPRSERTDTEISMIVSDVEFGNQMTRMFEADITKASALKVSNYEDVKYNESIIDSIMLMLSMRIGYDAL